MQNGLGEGIPSSSQTTGSRAAPLPVSLCERDIFPLPYFPTPPRVKGCRRTQKTTEPANDAVHCRRWRLLDTNPGYVGEVSLSWVGFWSKRSDGQGVEKILETPLLVRADVCDSAGEGLESEVVGVWEAWYWRTVLQWS